MNTIKFIAACACFTWAEAGYCSDFKPTHIGLHIASAHDKAGLNNINPGISLRWADAQGDGVVAGVYCNSFNSISAYAGYAWEWSLAPRWSASLAVGGVTGYPEIGSQFKGQSSGNVGCTRRTADERARPKAALLPFVLPGIAYHLDDKQSVRLEYIPKGHEKGSNAFHLMVVRKF